jgi:hypothetical protein
VQKLVKSEEPSPTSRALRRSISDFNANLEKRDTSNSKRNKKSILVQDHNVK